MKWDVFADILAVTSPVRMDWVRVAAGEFLMGSALAKDREASKGELSQHRVYLAEFYIGTRFRPSRVLISSCRCAS